MKRRAVVLYLVVMAVFTSLEIVTIAVASITNDLNSRDIVEIGGIFALITAFALVVGLVVVWNTTWDDAQN